MTAIETLLLRIVCWVVGILLIVLIIGGGAVAAYKALFEAKPAPVAETAAPAVVLPPTASTPYGSLEVARTATAPGTKAINPLPKGAKLQRQEAFTVQPRGLVLPSTMIAGSTYVPPPVTLNMDLSKLPDGTERVTASSPDGQITGALDVPVAPPPPESPKWAAGIAYGIPMGQVKSEGVWIERDIWRVRLGIEADHIAAARENSNVVMMRLGVTF